MDETPGVGYKFGKGLAYGLLLTTVMLVTMKLTGALPISWWLVLVPLWLPAGGCLIFVLALITIVGASKGNPFQ